MKEVNYSQRMKLKIEDREIFEALIETIPDMFFLIDRDGLIKNFMVNDESRLYVKPEIFIERQIKEVLPEKVSVQFDEAIKISEQTGDLALFNYELSYPEGIKSFECRLNKMISSDYFVAIVRDITEMSKINQALKDSEARYQTILENAPFPIIVDSIDKGCLLYANRRALELFSPLEKDLESVDLNRFFVDKKDRGVIRESLIRQHQLSDFEVKLYDKNHNVFWALISGVSITFENHNAYLVMINDISRLKEAIVELSNEKYNLNERVKEQQCNHDINIITEDYRGDMNEMMALILKSIIRGFQFEEYCEAKITIGEDVYCSEDYRETPWKIVSADVDMKYMPISVSVVYLENPLTTGEDPFLYQERNLLDLIRTRIVDTVNKRHMNEVIKEREGLLQVIFNQTGAGIVLIDPESLKIIEYNKSAAEMHGYTEKELEKLKISDLQADLSKEDVRNIITSLMDESYNEFEVNHRCKDGSIISLNSKLDKVVFNGQVYVSCVWTDISALKMSQERERKKSERLERDNRLFRALNYLEVSINGDIQKYFYELTELLADNLDLSRVSIWLFNETSESLNCQQMYDRKNKKHLSGGCINESLFKNEIAYFKNSRYVDAGDAFNDVRTSAYRKDFLEPMGLRAMLDCSIVSGANTIGTICFGHDEIHPWQEDEIILGCQIADHVGNTILNQERLRITEQLKQSETFLKRAQEVSKTGHWLMELSGSKILWSEEVYRIYEIPLNETITLERFLNTIYKEDYDRVVEAWEKAKKGNPFNIKHRINTPFQTKWIEVKAWMEYDETGSATVGLGTIQDVTERVEYETELNEYRVRLEEMVFQRTSELEDAMTIVEAASKAKTAFISNMSHEIRTPMNAIIGYAHLMKREPLSIKQGIQLEKLTNASMHLLQIVNDILDLSKIEADKLTIENKAFEPASVIENVFEIVEPSLANKRLDFFINVKDIPKTIIGDGARFGQVLLNLVNNAVKFTDKGSIKILGSVNQKWLRIEVKDTGIGLTEDQINKLFVAFNQADRSTTRLYGGTGLGLALSKKFLSLMGGNIGVTSVFGEGSTFWFEMPLVLGEENLAKTSEHSYFSGRKVLVIDDDSDVCEIMEGMFQDLAFETATAYSGAEGIEKIISADQAGNSFELVSVDYKMPGMNGVEVINTIRELPLHRQPSLMMVTAYSSEYNRIAHVNLEQAHLLTKPVTPHRLEECLHQLLTNKEAVPDHLTETQLKELFSKLGRKKILLAEDNPINREVAIQLLEFIDLEMYTAENGLKALEMAKSQVFDLVLMDIQMPVMDGLEATKNIRKIKEWTNVPIVAMTAHAFSEDIAHCSAAGMNDHISKPVEPQKLYEMIYKWLSDDKKSPRIQIQLANDNEEDLVNQGETILLQSINGLDVQSGLLTLNGNMKSYLNLLGQFVKNHGNDPSLFEELILHGECETLSQKAHSLKGVSATLGAIKIQKLSKDIELGAKEEGIALSELSKLNQALEAEVSQFKMDYHRVFEVLQPEDYQMKLGTINIAQMDALLSKIDELLTAYDTSVNDLMEESGRYLIEMFGDEARLLCSQINEFEYQNAKNTLHLLMNLRNV